MKSSNFKTLLTSNCLSRDKENITSSLSIILVISTDNKESSIRVKDMLFLLRLTSTQQPRNLISFNLSAVLLNISSK